MQRRDGAGHNGHAEYAPEREQTADVQHLPLSRRILHSTGRKAKG
jgi:hypothetical protein